MDFLFVNSIFQFLRESKGGGYFINNSIFKPFFLAFLGTIFFLIISRIKLKWNEYFKTKQKIWINKQTK